MNMQAILILACLFHVLVALASDSATAQVPVLDLGIENFDEELSTPKYKEGRCLIEFYAHWCPHCQHYKPVYEKIGRYFSGDPRPEPLIWVARVDCGIKENLPLCDRFKVLGYPTIFLGTRDDFLEGKIEALIKVPPKDPSVVINLINQKLGTQYVFEERAALMKQQPIKRERKETDDHFDLEDVERATVEIFERLFESTVILHSFDVREGFVNWVELLAVAHPSPRCRSSCRYLINQMGVLWPEHDDRPSPYMSQIKMCTVQYEKKEWGSCAGSTPDRRGFTCGLWQLLHSLTLGVQENEVELWMRGVRSFAQYFFGCAECAKHFLATMEREEASQVDSKTELVMWLWSIHNIVNRRLSQEEIEEGTGDPAFPKVQWPPEHLCPQCRSSFSFEGTVDWYEGSVQEFLYQFYSPLPSTQTGSIMGRKELIAGDREAVSTDVFSKEAAVAMELRNRSPVDITSYVLIAMIIAIVLIVRKSRKRKLVPRSKDLL